jgi:hypothetical protein
MLLIKSPPQDVLLGLSALGETAPRKAGGNLGTSAAFVVASPRSADEAFHPIRPESCSQRTGGRRVSKTTSFALNGVNNDPN